ncbi:hypothetical protein OH492_10445 [Vibrio chagasii]|nr:hypothetical protein [Vibrio chagasii]
MSWRSVAEQTSRSTLKPNLTSLAANVRWCLLPTSKDRPIEGVDIPVATPDV